MALSVCEHKVFEQLSLKEKKIETEKSEFLILKSIYYDSG